MVNHLIKISLTQQILSNRSFEISSDISDLTKLYESRTNYLKVIKDLGLNINIVDLGADESIDITITSRWKGNEFSVHKLKFSFSEI